MSTTRCWLVVSRRLCLVCLLCATKRSSTRQAASAAARRMEGSLSSRKGATWSRTNSSSGCGTRLKEPSVCSASRVS